MKKAERDAFHFSLRLVAKASLLTLLGVIFSKAATYGYRIIVAREFGAETYGLFSLALMIAGIFISIAGMGLADGVLRFFSYYRGKNEKEKIRSIFRSTFIILSLTSILFGALMFSLSESIALNIFHEPRLILFLKLFSASVPLSLISSLFLSALRAYEHIGAYSFIFNVLSNGARLLFLGILIFIGAQTEGVAISHLIGVLFMLLFSYAACRRYLPLLFIRPKVSKGELKEENRKLFSYSGFLFLATTVSFAFTWIDSFFIGMYSGTEAVGIYNVALALSVILTFPGELFLQLFFPLITKEYAAGNFSMIRQLSKQVGKWIFIVNLPLLIFVLVYPGAIINLLFGPEYLVAEKTLRILSFGTFFSSLMMISPQLIQMSGKSKLVSLNTLAASIVSIILNYMLVPRFGIEGAAIATAFSLVFYNFLFFLQGWKYLSILPLRRKMLKIFFVALIPVVAIIAFRSFIAQVTILHLIISGAVFVILYGFLLLITSCLDEHDSMILTAIKMKLENMRKH